MLNRLLLCRNSLLYIFASIALSLMVLPVIGGDRSNMRGERYGEVLLGRGGLLIPNEFDVYNTIGLNDCPEDLWKKLDAGKIKKENGVKAVILNGPRYWTIDGLTNSKLVDTTPKNFGGIEMRHAGTIELGLKDKLSLGRPYSIHKVARTTVWVFKAGKPVYELISADGSVYLMQSYSVQKENQTMDTLLQLASKLHLPSGWKFKSQILTKDYFVKAIDGMAYVVQDDLDNTYQKSTAKESDKL